MDGIDLLALHVASGESLLDVSGDPLILRTIMIPAITAVSLTPNPVSAGTSLLISVTVTETQYP